MAAYARSRAERARDQLRRRIVAGEWEINSRLPSEVELAEQFGVARGTIREAVRGLAELGMLETAAGRGTFVRSRTPTDGVLKDLLRGRGPAECLELRAAIEAEAARRLAISAEPGVLDHLAAATAPRENRVRAPGEFHVSLVEAGCGRLSVSLHTVLVGAVRDFLLDGSIDHALDDAHRGSEHEEIVNLIRAGDAAGAADAAARHALGDFVVV